MPEYFSRKEFLSQYIHAHTDQHPWQHTGHLYPLLPEKKKSNGRQRGVKDHWVCSALLIAPGWGDLMSQD